MTYSQIAVLVFEIGWPAVERIREGIKNGDEEVSDEQWNELRIRVNRRFKDIAGPRPKE
jgi:hypothetical protein